MVELRGFDELQQRLEIVFRFAGKPTMNDVRSETFGNRRAGFLQHRCRKCSPLEPRRISFSTGPLAC